MRHRLLSLLIAMVVAGELLAACGPVVINPTSTPTLEPTITSVATSTPTATPTAEPTATPTAVPTATPTAAPAAVTASQIADAVLKDVGTKGLTVEGSNDQRVIVLEERHNSRAAQVELAIMLNRLYLKHGLRDLALEGATVERGTPSADWFHKLPDPVIRRDVALYMLKEGEISAAEFMAMIYPDFRLHPIEVDAEYVVELSEAGQQALAASLEAYVQAFQQTSMAPDQQQRLIEHFRQLQDTSKIPSVCQMASILNGIVGTALEIGANVGDAEQGMQEARTFYETACKRNDTMVNNTSSLIPGSANGLVAMNIGAAHTSEIVDLLKSHSFSIAVLSPLSMKSENGDLTDAAYQRKLHDLSAGVTGTLGALLDHRRKPRPYIDQVLCQINAHIRVAGAIIARAAAAGGNSPFGLDNNKLGLADGDDGQPAPIRIDLQALEVIHSDGEAPKVAFPVQVTDTGEQFWMNVQQVAPEFRLDTSPGSPGSQPGSPEWSETLEQALKKILQSIKSEPAPSDPSVQQRETAFSPENPAPIMLAFDVKAIASTSEEAVKRG